MTMLEDLRECPFCGGSAEYIKKQYSGTGASGMEPYTVLAGCKKCNVWFSGGNEQEWDYERRWFDRKDEAYKEAATRWNTRTHAEQIERDARDAALWRMQQAKRIPSVTYGCHCDLEPDMEPDGCVIDDGTPELCIYASNIACKEQCPYWRKVESIDNAMRAEGGK